MASVIGTSRRGQGKSGDDTVKGVVRHAKNVRDLIEHEIIPRLLAAHWRSDRGEVGSGGQIHPEDIDKFAPLTMDLEADALLDEVETYIGRGVSADSLLIDLLAPTARKLGEYWEEDRVDFVDVTMGLWRLQQVMRDVSARRTPVINGVGASRRSLFSPYPGDQHNFGTMMIEEFFAQAGWDTDILLETDRHGLLQRLAAAPYDIVGLTISNDCTSEALASLLKAMRSVSRNPNIRVMIGGRVILENPDLVAESGADATANDPRDALHRAERLVEALLPQQSLTH